MLSVKTKIFSTTAKADGEDSLRPPGTVALAAMFPEEFFKNDSLVVIHSPFKNINFYKQKSSY